MIKKSYNKSFINLVCSVYIFLLYYYIILLLLLLLLYYYYYIIIIIIMIIIIIIPRSVIGWFIFSMLMAFISLVACTQIERKVAVRWVKFSWGGHEP